MDEPLIRLALLTRAGCRLCDEMKEVVDRLARSHRLALTVVDISTQPALERRWGFEIPVLLRDGRIVARHRITEQELAAALVRPTWPSP